MLVAQSCLTLCDSVDCSPPGSSVHGGSPAKNTGVFLPFPSPGDLPNPGRGWVKPGSPACGQILYYLNHQASGYSGRNLEDELEISLMTIMGIQVEW